MKKEYLKMVISCHTQEEYDELMAWAEENGYYWDSISEGQRPPTKGEHYVTKVGGWGIALTVGKNLLHSSTNYFRTLNGNYGPIVDCDDFLADRTVLKGLTGIEF